jgi:3-deoxy-D-manno-octulosonic-acid transferase
MWLLADLVYIVAAIVYSPVLLYEALVLRKNRGGWREKLFGPRPALHAGDRPRLWIHGVSLGEVNAARQLVRELETHRPGLEVVISSTTDTGYARACELFGAHRVFRYPLDFSWTVRRTLDRIRPAAVVLIELEVWFNLVTIAAQRNIPVAIVNGRLTERSARRFQWLGGLSRYMFAVLRWVGAQDEPTAARFAQVGVPRDHITVTGSLKWDTALVADSIPGQEALAAAMGLNPNQPIWVCGSTGPGEEELLLAAYAELRADFPELQFVLVPRKPERFNEVARLIEDRLYLCRRRSHLPDGSFVPPTSENVVWLGDTLGELRKFYALATVVFVGRSLVPMGGSDPMEVAALGKPMVTGPHMENFLLPSSVLAGSGSLRAVAEADDLAIAIRDWLSTPVAAESAGRAGQAVVRKHQGSTERTVQSLLRFFAKD